MTKKYLLKFLPYLVAITTGGIVYLLAIFLDAKFYDLLINVAATFFAIPLLYFFYETAKSFSHKKLNKEIFDYARMQVCRELLLILNQLQKIVYTLEEKDFSTKTINKLLSVEKGEIKNQLKSNKYLGFRVFKHWEVSEKGLHELLKNSFILGKMEDEHIVSIINILKSLRALEAVQGIDELYMETGETSKGYKVQGEIDMNLGDRKFPDRHLLLKHLSGDKFIACDFGDIPRYNLEKCLKYHKINNNIIDHYAEVIFILLKDINSWLNTTGSEFIVDTKMFKI